MPFVSHVNDIALRICPLGLKLRRVPGGYQMRKWYGKAIIIQAATFARTKQAIEYREAQLSQSPRQHPASPPAADAGRIGEFNTDPIQI